MSGHQPTQWTEDHVQLLLSNPRQLLEADDWREHIAALGGIDALYTAVRQLPIKEKQHTLLNVLISYPGASVDTYCDLLNVHRATFHRHQRELFRNLATLLNAARAASAHAPGPRVHQRQALHQLRTPSADFQGRSDLLETLKVALQPATDHAPIIGIQGMGGSGKTELALAAAQQVAARYPDAQLMLALHGSHAQWRTPEQLLQQVVQLFAPDEQQEQSREALEAQYRSCLHGKRVLIIADDARDADQVRSLLPPSGSAMLITSRQRFVLPGMAVIDIPLLDSAESAALLQTICRRLQPAEALELAERCGHLPLALRTSASILVNNPALPVANYLQRLRDRHQVLGALTDPDDRYLNVAASLELGYQALEPAAQAVLRQLSVIIGDFSVKLAAQVVQSDDLYTQLYTLIRRTMIRYDAHSERWWLHDLVRALAQRKLEHAESTAITWRYARAVLSLMPQILDAHVDIGGNREESLRLFNSERLHFDFAAEWAEAHSQQPDGARLLVDIAVAMANLSGIRQEYRYAYSRLMERGLAVAEELGDAAASGELHWRVGVNSIWTGDIDAAEQHFQAALAALAAEGSTSRVTHIRTDLASLYVYRGGEQNYHQAIQLYQKAIAAYRTLDESISQESLCLNNMGIAYAKLGQPETALECYQQALLLAERIDDQMDRCRALANMGETFITLGQLDAAITACQQAAAIAEAEGHLQGSGIITGYLAHAYMASGAVEQGHASYQQALSILASIGDRWSEADVRWKYGTQLVRFGNVEQALPLLQASLAYQAETNHGDYAQNAELLKRIEAGVPLAELLATL